GIAIDSIGNSPDAIFPALRVNITFNHPVADVNSGTDSWRNCKYAVIWLADEKFFNANDGNIIGGNQVDFMFRRRVSIPAGGEYVVFETDDNGKAWDKAQTYLESRNLYLDGDDQKWNDASLYDKYNSEVKEKVVNRGTAGLLDEVWSDAPSSDHLPWMMYEYIHPDEARYRTADLNGLEFYDYILKVIEKIETGYTKRYEELEERHTRRIERYRAKGELTAVEKIELAESEEVLKTVGRRIEEIKQDTLILKEFYRTRADDVLAKMISLSIEPGAPRDDWDSIIRVYGVPSEKIEMMKTKIDNYLSEARRQIAAHAEKVADLIIKGYKLPDGNVIVKPMNIESAMEAMQNLNTENVTGEGCANIMEAVRSVRLDYRNTPIMLTFSRNDKRNLKVFLSFLKEALERQYSGEPLTREAGSAQAAMPVTRSGTEIEKGVSQPLGSLIPGLAQSVITPGSLFGNGVRARLFVSPVIEETGRALSYFLGGVFGFTIFNFIFVLLHYPKYRTEFIKNYKYTHGGKSPPEILVLFATTAAPTLITAVSIVLAIALPGLSPISFFAINFISHFLINLSQKLFFEKEFTLDYMPGVTEVTDELLWKIMADHLKKTQDVEDVEAWKRENPEKAELLERQFDKIIKHNKELNAGLRNMHAQQVLIDENHPNFREVYSEVREVTDALLRAQGYDPKSFDIYLTDTNELNAFAILYSNKIFISLGLVKLLIERGGSKAALAYLLAHEFNHITQWLDDCLAGKEVDFTDNRPQESTAGEYDADIKALSLMDKAGYSVREASWLLKEFLKKERPRGLIWRILSMNTHPPTEERIRAMEKLVKTLYWNAYGNKLTYFGRAAADEIARRTFLREFQDRVITCRTYSDLADLLRGTHNLGELLFAMGIGYPMVFRNSDTEEIREDVFFVFEEMLHRLIDGGAGHEALFNFFRTEIYRKIQHRMLFLPAGERRERAQAMLESRVSEKRGSASAGDLNAILQLLTTGLPAKTKID
ncbi:MAG: M48 family metallopeptidase, partial [Candidatus Omnitrophica bacterium]|nr:M48 family metallopeptidase [Candidatus Omnitrophota bacterium]